MGDNYKGHRDFVQDAANHRNWIIDLTAGPDSCRKLVRDFGINLAQNATCGCDCIKANGAVAGDGAGKYSLPADYSAHVAFIGDTTIKVISVDLSVQTCREDIWRFGISPSHNERCNCNCVKIVLEGDDPNSSWPAPPYDLPVTVVINVGGGAARMAMKPKPENQLSLFNQPKEVEKSKPKKKPAGAVKIKKKPVQKAPVKKKPVVKKAKPKKTVKKDKLRAKNPKKAENKKRIVKRPIIKVVKKSSRPAGKPVNKRKVVKKNSKKTAKKKK